LRCFENDNIVHVEGSVDPIRDKEIIDFELQLKDLETVEKKLEKVKRAARTGNKESIKELEVLELLHKGLEQAQNIRGIALSDEDREAFVHPMQLLTDKPVLYVCNVDEGAAVQGNAFVDKVKETIAQENAELLVLAVSIEADINELESYEERQLFLEDLGLEEPGAAKLIRSAYNLLNQQTYFTAGEKEVRAWTISIGSSAPQAAGVIHTDFEKGFIRAEVISYADYDAYETETKVKEAGKMRIEGKEYIVSDGDVMHFRFNV
jgi:GTP-binding protein YchF